MFSLLQEREIQEPGCLSDKTASRENHFFRLLPDTVLSPSVKIFGLRCRDLIDSPANNKV